MHQYNTQNTLSILPNVKALEIQQKSGNGTVKLRLLCGKLRHVDLRQKKRPDQETFSKQWKLPGSPSSDLAPQHLLHTCSPYHHHPGCAVLEMMQGILYSLLCPGCHQMPRSLAPQRKELRDSQKTLLVLVLEELCRVCHCCVKTRS